MSVRENNHEREWAWENTSARATTTRQSSTPAIAHQHLKEASHVVKEDFPHRFQVCNLNFADIFFMMSFLWYQVSSSGTCMPKLDTKYRIEAHICPNSIPNIEWGTYVHQLRVGAHICVNSILGIELGRILLQLDTKYQIGAHICVGIRSLVLSLHQLRVGAHICVNSILGTWRFRSWWCKNWVYRHGKMWSKRVR